MLDTKESIQDKIDRLNKCSCTSMEQFEHIEKQLDILYAKLTALHATEKACNAFQHEVN